MSHVPVLLKEVLENLKPEAGEFFIDCTLGDGGHAEEILEKLGKKGKMMLVDWDKESISRFKKKKTENTILKEGNYADVKEFLKKEKVDGFLADLGFSSRQLEESGRGFSFSRNSEEPLLMTYSDSEEPVSQILKRLTEKEIADIIYKYGGERYSRRIARAIKEQERKEKIETNGKLAEVVRRALPRGYERGRIDPATRTFQAFRIYANKELENLEKLLQILPEIMKSGGRAGIITFHSLEDGLVKKYFKNYEKEGRAILLNKKPIIASREEIEKNPRSRSAKLRIIKFN
ncbi:MAG: 16S rRNA (cytosine(1402)-N(4))-methyltransferase RsmH [Candidatus Pacebacteria bacterium]|nr:16S rRNA (cytosine(1402)-N(4))-methyltransferase RsmH [Candidatus Paceibacterota bacterium]